MLFDIRRRRLGITLLNKRSSPASFNIRCRLSIVFFTICTFAAQFAWSDDQSWSLAAPQEAGAYTTYHAVLEVEGTIQWKAREKGDQQAPLAIRGELTFDERLLDMDPTAQSYRSARYYRSATVDYQLGKQKSKKRALAEDRRLMVASLINGKSAIASPQQPLSQDDLDLVDVPGCTLVLGQLLPTAEVKTGDSWPISEAALAPLVGITSVASSQVEATLDRIEGNVAIVRFAGDIDGKADGSRTTMKVEGKLNVDLKQQAVVWLAMVIREKREVSDTQPGLEVTARLRMAAKPSSEPIEQLSDAALPESIRQAEGLTDLIRVASSVGGFELLCDRQWRIIVDRHDSMILRCFDDNQLIAQVIVTPLNDSAPGKHLTMESFQADVAESLKEYTGQIVESAEATSDSGLRILRITAAGVVSEVSMQWINYHISNDQGRQIGITFSVQTDLVEKFASRDDAMIESFQFREKATTEVGQ